MQRTLFILAVIGAFIGGLGFLLSSIGNTAPIPDPQEQSLSFRVVERGQTMAASAPSKNFRIMNESEYRELVEVLHGQDESRVPPVDFSQEHLVIMFAGDQPTGGHTIGARVIAVTGERHTLVVTHTTPGPECVLTQGETRPYELIAIPASTPPLEHRDETRVTSCS